MNPPPKRIAKELNDLERFPPHGGMYFFQPAALSQMGTEPEQEDDGNQACGNASASTHEQKIDLSHLHGYIRGPEGTAFEGGVFVLHIFLGFDYPWKPPRIICLTPIYHPSVKKDGSSVWLPSGILYKDAWGPELTIAKVMQEFISMLETPDPEEFLEEAISDQFKTNRTEFDRVARDWTAKYAGDEKMPSSSGIIWKV
jgi:ubiquitin-conjugating enzyme E2 D